MSPQIERQAPPYRQITDHYRLQIQDGTLTEGTKLPPVSEVAREWGVAHATAAKAIAQLQVEGLVLTSPRGSFVAAQASRTTSPRERFIRAERSGSTAAASERHAVTAAEVVHPPAYVAELFDLEPDMKVVRREFTTFEGKMPRALTVTWHPANLAEQVPELLSTDQNDVGITLGRVEAVTGKIAKGRDFYHARGADQREADALGLPPGAAILAGTWLLWTADESSNERLIEYGETCIPPRHTVSYPYDLHDGE